MNKVNLNVCRGPKSELVATEDLGKVKLPEVTRSYVPVGHDQLRELVVAELAKDKISIVQEQHVFWRKGLRYFGLMQVEHEDIADGENALIIGLRNSLDKSLPATVGGGLDCFICDNLMFNAEYKVGRKHTTNIFSDIRGLIQTGIQNITSHWKDGLAQIGVYKNTELGDSKAHDLIVNAYRQGAIAKTGVADVIDQWHNPKHAEFNQPTLWKLQNAFTEVWKGRLDLVPARSKVLNGIMEREVRSRTEVTI